MILYEVETFLAPNWTISSSLLAKKYSTTHPLSYLDTYNTEETVKQPSHTLVILQFLLGLLCVSLYITGHYDFIHISVQNIITINTKNHLFTSW